MTPPTQAPPRRIEYIDVEKVEGAARNPRSHESIEKVRGSIRKYGFVESAVHDGRTGRIIAGHGRKEALLAMEEAGEDPPEGIIVGESGRWQMPLQYGWASADDAAAETLLVNLNRLVETGGWERDGLAEILDELRSENPEDFALSGFEFGEVDDMLAAIAQQAYDELDEESDPDDAPPRRSTPPRSRIGDVWLLGRHRLAVGDCTDPAVVAAALGGARAQLVFTDPPYGVDYEGHDGMKIINDDLSAKDLGRLLVGAFKVMRDVLIPGGAFYVCSPSGRLETTFRGALDDVDLELRSQIAWVKDSLVLGRADYHGQHETILYGWQLEGEPQLPPHFDPDHENLLYGWKGGAAHVFEGGRKQTTVWLYPKPRKSELHPTMKPVAMVRRAVCNSSTAGVERGRVLDLFAGAGSTLIACELSHRACSLVELDLPYADVICERFERQSGVVPVLERTGEAVSFVA